MAQPIGKRIQIPGQFTGAVTVESVTVVDDTVLLMVRTLEGELREAILSSTEIAEVFATQQQTSVTTVDGNAFFLFIESTRIKTAFAYDPHFAVSLSGVRPLPHQLEAVYERILPQVRLRFLLADDPGAGKTIMAGLLLKELKLRNAIDRVLIIAPAPLTIQWQDELRISSHTDLAIHPPTPQEQQKVENWLKVKVQRPLMDLERSQRQRELQIRQDYLQKAMESAIREAERTQMKLAGKVAQGDESYRVARDNAQNKVRDLRETLQK